MLALDPAFGTGGIVVTPIQPGNNDYVNAMTISPPGSTLAGNIIVAGDSQVSTSNTFNYNVSVAVYTPTGQPLTSFGTGGHVILPIGLAKNMVNGLGVQSTGDIIVAGYSWVHFNDLSVQQSTDPNFVSPITGIGLFGITSSVRPFTQRDIGQVINIPNTTANVANGWNPGNYTITAVDANGIAFLGDPPNTTSIVVGNAIPTVPAEWSMNTYDLTVAAILPTSGALDPAFGTNGNGFVVLPVGNSDTYGFSLYIQGDNRIVVAGYTNAGTASTPLYQFLVARFTAAGALDTSFGNGTGYVTTPVGISNAYANAVIEAGPWIYVVGSATATTNKVGIAIAQYSVTTGALNTSIGGGLGYTITTVGSTPALANAVVVNPANGELLIAGASFATNTGPATIILGEFNPTDDSLDTTFGGVNTGFASLPSTGSRDLANGVAVQSNGKIVIAGSELSSGKYAFLVARFHPNGTIDTSFGSGGKFVTPIGASDTVAPSSAATADGSAIAIIPGSNTTPDEIIVAGQSVGPAISTVPQGFDFTVAAYVGDTVNVPAAFQNPVQPLDVNDDGQITALDALIVINNLNAFGPRALPNSADGAPVGPPYVDVNGDGFVTPADALMVINYLNSLSATSALARVAAAAPQASALSSSTVTAPTATLAGSPAPDTATQAVTAGGPDPATTAAASSVVTPSSILSSSGSTASTSDLEDLLGLLAQAQVASTSAKL